MTAGVQIDFTAGDHHFDETGRRNGFFFQAETGKESRELTGTLQTDFLCRMALGLEEQEPQDKIAKLPAAAGFKDTDVTDAIGAIFPPDAAGAGGDAILKDEGIPAERVEIVGTAAENRGADGKNGGEVFAGSEPFTLDQ